MFQPVTPQVVRFSPLVSVHQSPYIGGSSLSAAKHYAKPGARHPYKSRVDGAGGVDHDVTSLYRELDVFEREESRKSRRHDLVEEDDSVDWDEESTLVAMFEDKTLEVDEREELAALADQLKAPMTAQAQRMKQQLREAIIPVIQQVKQVHDQLEDEVDLSFGKGLLVFDDACKRTEAKALHDEDELRTAYGDMQRNVESLFGQLEDVYRRRDQLWVEFEENLAQCAATARAAVEAIPAEVEDTITMLERKNKNMDKKGNGFASKQKMLKGLLDKL